MGGLDTPLVLNKYKPDSVVFLHEGSNLLGVVDCLVCGISDESEEKMTCFNLLSASVILI